MDIYRQLILDHYKNPQNFGHLPKPDKVAQAYNATCGDRILMEVSLSSKGVIKDVRFSGEGCAISQAAASILTEQAKGKKMKELLSMSRDDILELLHTTLTPSRVKCALLPLEVLQKALSSV